MNDPSDRFAHTRATIITLPKCYCGHFETDHDPNHATECQHPDCDCSKYREAPRP
jgi:hypothetical protein